LLLAINAGVIPACIPYIEGCTSVSATGRYDPAAFLFKPAMTTEAVLMAIYWLCSVAWLRALSRSAGQRRQPGPAIAILGFGSAIALIVYVTFLGTQTPLYEFMRRFGIYFYFLFAVIAQLMMAGKAIGLARALGLPTVLKISRLQMWLAIVPFALGALNLVLKATMADAGSPERVIEWIFGLLMHVYFVLSYFSWRDTGFAADWKIAGNRH